MSEAPKVEEQVAVPAPVETPAPAVEPEVPAATETVEAPGTDAPATEAAPEATEPAVEAAPEEVKPIEEGILGYKGPGFVKSLIFQKKFFWFGTEPVEHKALASYLRGEKQQDAANKNAAWAAHTGKGLLYFSKKASEKATPHGIFNLSEVTDITEEGTVAFFFNYGGHKHTFETTTLADRNGWVLALKTKSAEAKEAAPAVAESEEYKKAIAELTPVAAAASLPKKSADKAVETKAEDREEKTEKPEDKKEAKEEKKADKLEEKKARTKSRSASRKRNSIFGGFLGKKEEKAEVPEAETAAPAPAVEEPVAAAEPVATPEITETAPVEAAPVVEKPTPAKRNSIFGTLKSQFSNKGEKKTEEAPVVPVKDAEPVSENAPVIPAVEASEPLQTSVEAPAPAPAEVTEAPVTNGDVPAEAPVIKSDKRKSSLPFFGSKKEKATSDEESTEKPFFAKLRATVKGKKSEKVSEKPAEAAPEVAASPAAEETSAVVEPAVVSEPEPVVSTATPQVAASA